MGRVTIGNIVKCDNKPVDDCWQVSTQIVGDENSKDNGDPASSSQMCWSVTMSDGTQGDNACWSVTGNDRCRQNPNPLFERDMDLEKHGIFKAYAVHISHEFIYMAVEMREPDDPETETYTDDWASALVNGGTPDKWVYKPTYKATEIVRVYDVFGDLPYEEYTDSYGYKWVIRDSKDIVFSVDYKMDMGLRIVKGLFSSAWDMQGHYMAYIEKSVSLTETLVGDGCLLMGKEVSTLNPTIVFTAKDKTSWKIYDGINGLDIIKLDTVGLNYMLTDTLAMKHESSSYYDVVANQGHGKMFSNSEPKQTDYLGYTTVVGIMQYDGHPYPSNDNTVGFIVKVVDSPKVKNTPVFFSSLKYIFYYNPPPAQWTGVGKTGHVVGGELYDGTGYHPYPIPVIPVEPLDEGGDSIVLHISGRTESHGFSTKGHSTFYGMTGGNTVNEDFFKLKEYDTPKENRVRISGQDHLLQEKDFFVVMEEQLVWFRYEPIYGNSISHRLFPMYDATKLTDFCLWNNQVIIADGTKRLKVRTLA